MKNTGHGVRRVVCGLAAGTVVLAGLQAATVTPASAATRDGIVDVAKAELGKASRNVEKPAGSGCNYYTGYFRTWKSASGCGSADGVQFRDSDWCADFAKYVWKNAGVAYADVPETSGGVLTGWASSFKDYGVAHGTWHTRASGYAPQPGDSLVFDWDHDGGIDHVGIVTSSTASTVYTIEGNSGDATRSRSYSRSDADIVGYSAPIVDSVPPAPTVVDGRTRFADLDGDGRDELIGIWADGTVHAYRNAGWDAAKVYDGVDTKVVASGFTDPERTKFADLDGDGRAEIIGIWADGSVHAYRNAGWDAPKVYDGVDVKVVASGFKDATRTTFADVDGDGRDDLVGPYANGDVHVYRNLGWDAATVFDGNVQKVVASGFSAPGTKFADVDGDGRAEIMAFYANGDVHVYRNLGWDAAKVFDGNVQKVVASGFGDQSRTKFGDLDGDGRAEIVSIFADKTVHAYRNLGWDASPNVYDGNVQKIVASGFDA
ncbi:FG-GAP-like repeat-containing protein [Streptosporangium sp. NPDC004379]|uniref:FG-GAP-like repeat-containing protein n=1 Tax=Streptosporangium sp. NPDC004379 TaxID=3366189 RepID=UPI0036A92119